MDYYMQQIVNYNLGNDDSEIPYPVIDSTQSSPHGQAAVTAPANPPQDNNNNVTIPAARVVQNPTTIPTGPYCLEVQGNPMITYADGNGNSFCQPLDHPVLPGFYIHQVHTDTQAPRYQPPPVYNTINHQAGGPDLNMVFTGMTHNPQQGYVPLQRYTQYMGTPIHQAIQCPMEYQSPQRTHIPDPAPPNLTTWASSKFSNADHTYVNSKLLEDREWEVLTEEDKGQGYKSKGKGNGKGREVVR